MTDPLAGKDEDPYLLLGVDSSAGRTEIDAAMDAFNEKTPGRELEVIDARDSLCEPSRRLLIDFFRYAPPEGEPAKAPDLGPLFDRALAEVRAEMDTQKAGLVFGPAKAVLTVIEFENKEA